LLNTTDMISVIDIQNPDVIAMAQRAEQFLTEHRWCKHIIGRWLAWALVDKAGVFYFRLEPVREGIDNELWLIVGDLPPAYIVCDNASTWQEALDAYAVEMMKWVEAVREGRGIEDVIPVNVSPTAEHADMLATRCELIWTLFVDIDPTTLPTER
jgi:hypothetical protein